MPNKSIRNEAMRIGGEKVFTEALVEVTYPFTEEVIAVDYQDARKVALARNPGATVIGVTAV